MPWIRRRVVCGLSETIATFAPASALTSVDFPTFGLPATATKPLLTPHPHPGGVHPASLAVDDTPPSGTRAKRGCDASRRARADSSLRQIPCLRQKLGGRERGDRPVGRAEDHS